ncbi:hypothetical protein CONCODRAFT_8470 [Conidiobolus coronatus NRRL 28638]|uniref:Zn(2)-C6 fungal-type domain-containing protein n=1 Tax=Conidiobolus coronatus (strain ATCC 28846 / CBS 209.66 / NRRL 28638) TaxID=796925 RepID=A0A137P292_CONC2|nr:hypothetical protein CONCODRAFT_8470 [Conidiobolus coronatus NRRL 28638]|eukprot:KXN69132.1 hypothetical protein CONCODRAFT_8470 [Conidiobolus coronatus NRRL 28638]
MNLTFRISNNNKPKYEFACERCRLDKKKCDKKVPICSRCIKIQAECRTYSKDTAGVKGFKLLVQRNNVNICNTDGTNMLKPVSITVNKLFLSPYPPMSNTLEYSKFMCLMSLSLDMITKSDKSQSALIPLDNIDHTLSPLFWDMLVKLYLEEVHPNLIILSLNYFDITTCWLRACCIYLCAYEICKIRNSITDLKMKTMESLILKELNYTRPSLRTLQCYIMLTHLYIFRGNKNLKRYSFIKSVKIGELIGLPRSCNRQSKIAQYERNLAYIRILLFHTGICEYSDGEGMIYEAVKTKHTSWEFQLLNPLQYSYNEFIIANSNNITALFICNTVTRVLFPIKLLLKLGKIDITKILEFKIILEQIYNTHINQLGPCYLDHSLYKIKEIYFIIKIQIYSLLVNQCPKEEYIHNWMQLNYDILQFSFSLTDKFDAMKVIQSLVCINSCQKIKSIGKCDTWSKDLDKIMFLSRSVIKSCTSYNYQFDWGVFYQ